MSNVTARAWRIEIKSKKEVHARSLGAEPETVTETGGGSLIERRLAKKTGIERSRIADNARQQNELTMDRL